MHLHVDSPWVSLGLLGGGGVSSGGSGNGREEDGDAEEPATKKAKAATTTAGASSSRSAATTATSSRSTSPRYLTPMSWPDQEVGPCSSAAMSCTSVPSCFTIFPDKMACLSPSVALTIPPPPTNAPPFPVKPALPPLSSRAVDRFFSFFACIIASALPSVNRGDFSNLWWISDSFVKLGRSPEPPPLADLMGLTPTPLRFDGSTDTDLDVTSVGNSSRFGSKVGSVEGACHVTVSPFADTSNAASDDFSRATSAFQSGSGPPYVCACSGRELPSRDCGAELLDSRLPSDRDIFVLPMASRPRLRCSRFCFCSSDILASSLSLWAASFSRRLPSFKARRAVRTTSFMKSCSGSSTGCRDDAIAPTDEPLVPGPTPLLSFGNRPSAKLYRRICVGNS